MTNFAVLKNFSFDLEPKFESLTNEQIINKLEDHIEYHSFLTSLELFEKIYQILEPKHDDPNVGHMVEVMNCIYTEHYMIQNLYLDRYDDKPYKNVIIIKRKINENDDYRFTKFDPNNLSNDPYQYLNVTQSDVIEVIRKKYIHNGVVVECDGNIRPIQYLTNQIDNHKGNLFVKNNLSDENYSKLKFLSVGSIMMDKHKNNENNEINVENNENNENNEIAKSIETYLKDDFEICLLSSQVNIHFGLLDCFYFINGSEKNIKMTNIVGYDIYGDVFVGLEDNIQNDMIIDMTPNLFSNIYNILTENKKVRRKNHSFFNVYHELL